MGRESSVKNGTAATDPKAAAIIDELIVLLSKSGSLDYHAVDHGIEYMASAKARWPKLAITLSLAPLVEKAMRRGVTAGVKSRMTDQEIRIDFAQRIRRRLKAMPRSTFPGPREDMWELAERVVQSVLEECEED